MHVSKEKQQHTKSLARLLLIQGHSISETAKQLGLHRTTVHRYHGQLIKAENFKVTLAECALAASESLVRLQDYPTDILRAYLETSPADPLASYRANEIIRQRGGKQW